MNKKEQFVYDNLKEYFEDVTNCGYEEGSCKYITGSGKMCVFGKNLIDPKRIEGLYSQKAASSILRSEDEHVLKEEARGILDEHEWDSMQVIHDSLVEDTLSNEKLSTNLNCIGVPKIYDKLLSLKTTK